MLSKWNKFWFAAEKPDLLGLYRIVLFSYLLVLLVVGFVLQKTYDCAHFQPIGIFSIIGFPCSDQFIDYLYIFGMVSAFFAALGVYYKVSGKVAAFCALFVLGYEYNFHEVYHGYHVFVMTLLIVSFSKADAAFSIRSKKAKHKHEESYKFRWPVQLCKSYVVYVYVLVGCERLYFGGLDWIFSENLQLIVFTKPQLSMLGEWFLTLPVPAVMCFSFTAVVICELLSPLAFKNKYTGALYWFFWLFFHLGVSLVLGRHKSFFSQMPAASVFILPLLMEVFSRGQNLSIPTVSHKDNEV